MTHKDRWLRFGSEIVFALCEEFNVEVTVINQREKPLRFEEELAGDVLKIITVFSAWLQYSRSHQNRINIPPVDGWIELLICSTIVLCLFYAAARPNWL